MKEKVFIFLGLRPELMAEGKGCIGRGGQNIQEQFVLCV